MVGNWHHAFTNSIVVGEVRRTKDDFDGQLAQAYVDDDETDDDVTHMQPYGLSARPPSGSRGLLLALNGDPAERVAVCVSPRGRPKSLAEGEVVNWCIHGQTIRLQQDGGITIDTQGGAKIECLAGGGIVLTIAGGQQIKLGGPGAALAVARETDPVQPTAAFIAYMTLLETIINALIPGSFTPANSFATTIAGAQNFAYILQGSPTIKST